MSPIPEMSRRSQADRGPSTTAKTRYWLLFVCLFAGVIHGGFFFLRPPTPPSPDEREYGALGVGLIGQKAAEAVGRNPGASGKILTQAIIGMALAEGLGILALFLAK